MNENKKSKRDIFISLTRRKAKKKVQESSIRQGRKLTKDEIHEIIENEARKAKIKTIAFAMAGMMGIGGLGTYTVTKWLNPGMDRIDENKTEITVDVDSADKDITINNMNTDRELFVNGLQVDLEVDTNEYIRKELESSVRREVDKLISQNKVLDYLKGIYAEEYNKVRDEKISSEDVSFHKQQFYVYIYKDQDGVYRFSDKGDKYADNSDGTLISARGEKITNYNNSDKYYEVYREDEEVKNDKTNILLSISRLVDTGIDLHVAQGQSGTSSEVMETYKERFRNALVEYKMGQISEIMTGENTAQKNADAKGFEPGE